MTPADITGDNNFTLYKGAKWEHTLTFTETATGDPLVLTDLDPFVITLTNANSGTVLANGTVVNTDLAGGVITVSFTAAQTLALAAALLPLAGLNSCTAPRAYPPGTPDPLDQPGTPEPTAAELHAKNIAAITGNPTKLP